MKEILFRDENLKVPQKTKVASIPTPTLSKAEIRQTLKRITKYPHYINIIGGFGILSFDDLDKEFTINFSWLSLPVLCLIGQSVTQIFYCVLYFNNFKYLSLLVNFRSAGESGEADNLVEIGLTILAVFGHMSLRLSYLVRHKSFLAFHRKLVEISTKLVLLEGKGDEGFEDNREHLRHFTNLEAFVLKIYKRIVLHATLVGLLMAKLPYSVLADTTNHLPVWSRVLVVILGGDMWFVGHGFFINHVVWLSVHVKWMGTLFQLIAKKSELISERK